MVEIPISDNAEITQTTVYPNLESIWLGQITTFPWFDKYSPETKRMIRYAMYTGVAEALRLVIYRLNMDQNESVFEEIDQEIRAEDLALQAIAESYSAAIQ